MDAKFKRKMIDMLALMNRAINDTRLYPSNSPTIKKSVEKLYKNLEPILQAKEGLVISESEKDLFINGEPFSFKDLKKSIVATFFDFFLDHRRAHGIFIRKTQVFLDKFEDDRETLLEDMIDFLRDWLVKHIGRADKLYVPLFTEKGLV